MLPVASGACRAPMMRRMTQLQSVEKRQRNTLPFGVKAAQASISEHQRDITTPTHHMETVESLVQTVEGLNVGTDGSMSGG